MTLKATRYRLTDLTDMLIPRPIPAGTKVLIKFSITNPTMDVVGLLLQNNWSETTPHNWAIWCATPDEVDAARDGLRSHFGEPDADGISSGK